MINKEAEEKKILATRHDYYFFSFYTMVRSHQSFLSLSILSFFFSLYHSLSLWLANSYLKEKLMSFLTFSYLREWIASECVGNRHDFGKKTFSSCFRYCFFLSSFSFSIRKIDPMALLFIPMRYFILVLVLIHSVTLYKIYAFNDDDDDVSHFSSIFPFNNICLCF